MIVNKDNNGKPIGFIETLFTNDRVVTVNATQDATTVTMRNRSDGQVETEMFFGTVPFTPKG